MKEFKAAFAVEYEIGAPTNWIPAIEEINVMDPLFWVITFEKTLVTFNALVKLVFQESSHSLFEYKGSKSTEPFPTFEIKISNLLFVLR